MKKRSLFAAVAMLLVSAVVLTSATYAWFAAGTTVSVNPVYASISQSDGSIQISADQSSWKAVLTYDDLAAQAGNNVGSQASPVTLVPVSFNKATGSFVGGAITSGTFQAAAANGANYIHYTAYLKADAETEVRITPTLDNNSVSYIYAYVSCGSEKTVRNNGTAGKYYPVTAAAGTSIPDSNDNRIVDDDGHNAYTVNSVTDGAPTSFDANVPSGALGGVVEPDTNDLTVTLAAGVVTPVNVYLWAEGQNIACNGSISNTVVNCALTVSKAS